MAHTAPLATTNTAASPTRSADRTPDARLGITPVWNPMVILAFFYGVLFLVFAAIVAFIFVRRRRRALALARAEDTATTATTSDPEKTQASVSGESGVSGDGDADKTVFIAQAGVAEECKGARASDGSATVADSGTKRDAPSEYWTPPLRRSMPFSSRASTPMLLRYQCNVSELSIAQRDMSQVLVWLPSFQSNAGGAAGAGSGPGPAGAGAGAGEGEPASEKVSTEEQARDQEGAGEQEQTQEEQKELERQEREETKEDSESGCGVAQ